VNRGPARRDAGDSMPDPDHPEAADKWRRFAAGIGIGTAASAVLWIAAFNMPSYPWLHAIIGLACVVVPGAKLVVAATLMSRPDSRPFGAGLLASLGTGFLVLVGTCAASLTRAQ